MSILRKLVLAVPVALGIVAAATDPASAGMVLNNHCQPTSTADRAARRPASKRTVRRGLAIGLAALTVGLGVQVASIDPDHTSTVPSARPTGFPPAPVAGPAA